MAKRLVHVILLSTLLGLPSLVDAAILRYASRPLDSSADPDARIPQLIIADTAAECPSSDVGDGDVCYGKDSDIHRLRQNGAWVTVTISTHTHTLVGDVDGDIGTTDLDEAAVEAEIESVVDLADLQGQITDAQIADGAVDGGTGGEVADASITAADLATDSVSSDELNATGVESELEAVIDLTDLQGQLGNAQLADGSVDGGTGGEIEDGTITSADVAAALKTNQYAFTIYDPNGLSTDDDVPSIIPNRARAVTITEVYCESNDGTAVINLQRDDGSPANILSSNCTCGSSGTACTIDTNEDNLADGNNVDFLLISETAVTRVNVQLTYTVD